MFWNQDEKDVNKYWTSDFWLFKDERNVTVEFYVVIKDENRLNLVGTKKVNLNISHKVVLNKECFGTIFFTVVK